MGSKISPPSLYYGQNGDKKAGTLQTIKYTIVSNDGHEVCDEDTFFTDGRTQGKVTADLLVPRAGMGLTIVDDILNHRDVVLRIGVLDGKIHKLPARVTQLEFTGQFQDGKCVCAAEFMTKKPQVTS